ncbi:MAG: hypothetical protein AB1515_07190 [Nitrospirota bacterium]
MLGIGWPEFLFLLALLLVVFRPEQLADLVRTAGEFSGQLLRMGRQLRDEVEREWQQAPPPSTKRLPHPPEEPPAP